MSIGNLAALAATVALAPAVTRSAQIQLGCAAIYVAVCAFRSFFPRVDLERTVLVDHWLSSVALGRTAATLAELAFTVQCAVFVLDLAAAGASPGVLSAVAWALVPLIAVAQGCCWLGVLTLRHRWHAAEEALWAVAMALLSVAFVLAWPGADAVVRAALAVGLGGCAVGAWVMAGVDIPMYLRRDAAERAAGARVLSVPEGLADALRRRVPTGSWAVWRPEATWMTPYFSAAVWGSIALVWLSVR